MNSKVAAALLAVVVLGGACAPEPAPAPAPAPQQAPAMDPGASAPPASAPPPTTALRPTEGVPEPAYTRVLEVSSQDTYEAAVDGARAGDDIVLAEGSYEPVSIEDKTGPIRVRCATALGCVLGGEDTLEVSGSTQITLGPGLKFAGTQYTAVKLDGSNNTRTTGNLFALQPGEDDSSKWFLIGGVSSRHRIDHNTFQGKADEGNYITVDGTETQVSQYDTIDHNVFRDLRPPASDEKEAIRLGWSQISMSQSFSVIEHNLFDECDGDTEVVSVKASDSVVRHNTVTRSQGGLVLRHGDRSQVYGNLIDGQGKTGTGGIRMYGRDNVVRDNWIEDVSGSSYESAFSIDGGDVDQSGELDGHWRNYRLAALNNTILRARTGVVLGEHYELGPVDTTLSGNEYVAAPDVRDVKSSGTVRENGDGVRDGPTHPRPQEKVAAAGGVGIRG